MTSKQKTQQLQVTAKASIKGVPIVTPGIKNDGKTQEKVAVARKVLSHLNSRFEVVQEYPQYDGHLTVAENIVNGKHLTVQYIFRGKQQEEFITEASGNYELVPLDLFKEVGDQVAKEEKAVPWSQFPGEWFVKSNQNVIYNKNRTQMHALYAFDDKLEIKKGESLNYGFSLHNSIDGKTGLGVAIWTFRHACQNMFFMGLRGRGQERDDRNVLAYTIKKHYAEGIGNRNATSAENLTNLKSKVRALILQVTDAGKSVAADIRALNDRILNQETAERLFNHVIQSKKVLPEIFPYIEFEEKVKGRSRADKVKLTRNDVTCYDAWLDATYLVSHSEGTSPLVRMIRFAELDKTLLQQAPLQVARKAGNNNGGITPRKV